MNSIPQTPVRKRLHKEPPAHKSNPKNLYSCQGIFDVVRAQSCLTIFSDNEDEMTTTNWISCRESDQPRSHAGFRVQHRSLNASDLEDSPSVYSSADEMELSPLKRTRPKTPVFAVGQLERASLIRQFDEAQIFAEGYQSALPPRIESPCLEQQASKRSTRTLRKIKCQPSLRDLVKDQAKDSPRTSTSSSDAETLVGSESPTSPTSPKEGGFFAKEEMALIRPSQLSDNTGDDKNFDTDVGLKICLDLLTDELATALFRQHPAENADRASGLQILLMIEAYETVQQQVRQKLYHAHVQGKMEYHVESVEKILDYWLQVLYSVYDRSQERKTSGKLQAEEWPLQNLSEDCYPPSL